MRRISLQTFGGPDGGVLAAYDLQLLAIDNIFRAPFSGVLPS
jgi:hypothetical protein